MCFKSSVRRMAALLLMILIAIMIPVMQVHAVIGTATLIGVAAAVVVTSVLVALGVTNKDTAGFDAMVDRVVSKIPDLGNVLSPGTWAMWATQGVAYVSKEVVEAVRDAAVSEGCFSNLTAWGGQWYVVPATGVMIPYVGTTGVDLLPADYPGFFHISQYSRGVYTILPGITMYVDHPDHYSDPESVYKRICVHIVGYQNYVFLGGWKYGYNSDTFAICARYRSSNVYQFFFISNFSFGDTGRWSSTSHDSSVIGQGKVIDIPYGQTGALPSIEGAIDNDFPGWVKERGICIDGTGAITGSYADAEGKSISVPLAIPGVSDRAGAGQLTQEQAQAGTVTEGTVADGKTAASAVEMDETLGKLVLPADITGYFPFCIPFDIVRGIKMLQAPGVAPEIVIPLKAPEYGLDWEFKMDWSMFEPVIKIVRWGEGLVFVICLAAVTKKLTWG